MSWPAARGSGAPSVYVVWQDGALHRSQPTVSRPRGRLTAPSLVVYHAIDRVRGPNGWVSVVSWPSLEYALRGCPPRMRRATSDSSPFGRYLATQHVRERSMLTCASQIGRRLEHVDVPCAPSDFFFWTTDDLLVTLANGAGQTCTTSGSAIDTATTEYGGALASQDGSTIAYWDSDRARLLSRSAAKARRRPWMPPPTFGTCYPSPDGSHSSWRWLATRSTWACSSRAAGSRSGGRRGSARQG